jgi:hypothetical protein
MLCTCVGSAQATASAQVTEVMGSRAAGMGGAFVAVASDSSATWWNPAGLAPGPFFDMALSRAVVEVSPTGQSADTLARTGGWRHHLSGFALGTPPLGVSYYRFRLTDIQRFDPTESTPAGREDRRAGVPVRSLAANQLGVTLVQTVIPGVHAGATLKYLRGTVAAAHGDAFARPSELLDLGEGLAGDDTDGQFDLDLGVLATAGVVRLGARMRNVLQPSVGVPLERQVRVGVAVDAEAGGGVPLTIALDADVDAYQTATGARRVMALGAEQWLWDRRVGLRAGGRINTTGARERSATAGASVALRVGLYVEGHVVRGGSVDERGWGIAARVSF